MWARIADIAFRIITLGIKERKGAAQRKADALQDKLVAVREKLRVQTIKARESA